MINANNKLKVHGVFFHFIVSLSPLIGFAVNKKLGNAVARNRFKRQCRAIMFSKKLSTSLHLVVQPVIPLEKIIHLPECFEKLRECVDGS